MSSKKHGSSSSDFFTLPFLLSVIQLLVLKSCMPIVDLFPSRKLVLPHPTQDWHLAQLGCAQHPEPKVPSWFSVFNTVFVHELCTGGGGRGRGGRNFARVPLRRASEVRPSGRSQHPSIHRGREDNGTGRGQGDEGGSVAALRRWWSSGEVCDVGEVGSRVKID